MTFVNYRVLEEASAFYWLDSIDRERIRSGVAPNDADAVKKLLRDSWLPWISQTPDWIAYRENLKINLRYYLTTREFPIEDVYYMCEPAQWLPDNPFDYYVWVWEVLFDDEEYRLASTDGFVELLDAEVCADGSIRPKPKPRPWRWPWQRQMYDQP